MQTKPKSNSIVTHLWDMEKGTITFVVAGATGTNPVLEMAKVHEGNKQRAMYHGMTQRGSDGAAIPRNTKTGLSATPEEKRAAIAEIVEHYNSGAEAWRLTGTRDDTSLTMQAIARVKGVEYAVAEGFVKTFADAKHGGDVKKALAFLRDGQRVREAMDAIRSERMPKAKVDADEALDEFEAEGAGDEEAMSEEAMSELANLAQQAATDSRIP